jgi:hypothetical protein
MDGSVSDAKPIWVISFERNISMATMINGFISRFGDCVDTQIFLSGKGRCFCCFENLRRIEGVPRVTYHRRQIDTSPSGTILTNVGHAYPTFLNADSPSETHADLAIIRQRENANDLAHIVEPNSLLFVEIIINNGSDHETESTDEIGSHCHKSRADECG